MRVAHLSLTNFRNYTRLQADLPAGPLILVGNNAQGKTSLLEAIYYLATASSPHATTDRQLIHWLALRNDPRPFLKIVAEVHTAREIRRVDIRLEVEDVGAAGVFVDGNWPVRHRRRGPDRRLVRAVVAADIVEPGRFLRPVRSATRLNPTVRRQKHNLGGNYGTGSFLC